MKKIIIIIIAVVICALAVGIFVVKNRLKNTVLDGPDMEYVPTVKEITYDCGADEYGRVKSWHLHDWQLEYSYDGGTVEVSTESQCDVAIDFYNALDEIISEYKVKSWTELDENDISVLDGAKTSFIIEFTDGTVVKLGDDYLMPENGWKAVSEIIGLFETCIDNAN